MSLISDLFRYTVVIFFFLDIIMVTFIIYPPDSYNPFVNISEDEISIWDNNTNELTIKKEIKHKSTREYDTVTVKVNFYNNNSECFKTINVTNNTKNHKLFINTIVKLPEKPHHIKCKIMKIGSNT